MLQRCIEQARAHDSKGRVAIYAIALDKRGRIIGEGGNLYTKTSTVQARVARRAGFPHKQFLHAECVAITRARGKTIHKIIVARLDRNGNVGYAKPCEVCAMLIKEVEELQGGKIVVEHT